MQIKLKKKPEKVAAPREAKAAGERKSSEISLNTVRSAWLIEAAAAMLTSVVAIIVASAF